MGETDPPALLGRLVVLTGIAITAAGLLLIYGPRLPHLGRLPGDLVLRRGGFRLYVPITTSLVLSAALTLLLWVLSLLRR